MSDNEWENDDVIEDIAKPKKFDDEKEEIEKKKIEPKIEKPKEDDLSSYEYKWQQKNKEKIEKQKELQDALKGLDEKEKAKILEEKRKQEDIEDFLDIDKIDKKKVSKNQKLLENENDFIQLAVTVAAKLNGNAKTPMKYRATFIKETLEQLAPLLDLKTINEYIKDLTISFNTKRNKESGKKPSAKTKKPKLAAGKGVDTVKGQNNEYADDYNDEYYEEEDYIK